MLNKTYNRHCSFPDDVIMKQSARLVSFYEMRSALNRHQKQVYTWDIREGSEAVSESL